MRLKNSPVEFDPESHTYHLDGVVLQGITGMIARQLFPTMYKNVPQHIMAKAAKKGTLVHETIELVDTMGVKSDLPQVENYKRLCEANNLLHYKTEYLVSDEKNFASCIDKVFTSEGYADNEFDLGDIKTTYELHTDYVQWQLSVYAYLMELQNPDAKVKRLFAIWLRDEKAEFVEVERIPTAEVEKLLECEINGEQYQTREVAQIPEKYVALQQSLIDMERQCKEMEMKRKEILSALKGEMEKAGVKTWETDMLKFTIKAPTKRETFDTKRFKENYPELASEFIKTSNVASSIVMTIK